MSPIRGSRPPNVAESPAGTSVIFVLAGAATVTGGASALARVTRCDVPLQAVTVTHNASKAHLKGLDLVCSIQHLSVTKISSLMAAMPDTAARRAP